ncbi:hypothetical protein MPH_00189 [Macrophomina phaseolina MS6]|uniref:Avirulence Effector AvrLm4-7 domain-containing protein n=2 Tax=Macrophomina phaseolina TaxID=35725 RepID=K2SJ40_MACPH|nr:hypothetical protein MPH_00189 [Macrophomina phaseolina MS6]KAH7015970.1 hypothetical protein B0J12DRAFT_775592 [Macrophomina phaseolina]
MLRRFVLLFALSFILYLPAAQACRQKYIEWYKYAPCKAKKSDIDGECWEIQRKMRDYSNANQKIWGGQFTADNICQSCESDGQMWCTCTVRAWRFREWMVDPGSWKWPAMPSGWDRVDPDNGLNGWYDTGHKNIDCD